MKSPGILIVIVIVMSCQTNPSNSHYQKTWSKADRNFLLDNLESSLKAVFEEVDSLSETQWNWKPNDSTWSVAEVIEHLIVHDELFYREARVLTGIPEMTPQEAALFSEDSIISSYREITPQNIGRSPSYMEPLGRWCSKEDALSAYSRIRTALVDFVKTTDKDLRKIYTSSGRGPTTYRDLHQLLLISVAHTQRHLKQIKKIKSEEGFSSE